MTDSEAVNAVLQGNREMFEVIVRRHNVQLYRTGLAYLRNGHVRIDVVVSRLSPRTTAWIELAGLLVFALPYCLVLINYGADFAWKAWVSGEGSESATGLPWRWIAKSIMELGLLLLLLAVTAMMARLAVFLFGPAALREQARPPNIKA